MGTEIKPDEAAPIPGKSGTTPPQPRESTPDTGPIVAPKINGFQENFDYNANPLSTDTSDKQPTATNLLATDPPTTMAGAMGLPPASDVSLGCETIPTNEPASGETPSALETPATGPCSPPPNPQPKTFDLVRALKQGWAEANNPLVSTFRTLNENRLAWLATIFTTAVAAIIRLWELGRIKKIIFDETYYVKDSYSLWHKGFEGVWTKDWDQHFVAKDFSGLQDQGAFVVHPPLGKWLIGLGMRVFGDTNPWGWRIMAALFGIALVYLTARLAWNLFHSAPLVLIAGMLAGTDGINIVMSRIGILDIFLATLCLAGFLAVVKDQQESRQILARRLHRWRREPRLKWYLDLGPNSGPRMWLMVAGICFGLASSVKWSALYPLAIMGIFVVLRDFTARISAKMPWKIAICGTIVRDGFLAFAMLVPSAVLTYLLTWWSWFTHPKAYGHRGNGSGPITGLMDLWNYHLQTMKFHQGVTSSHPYSSKPWQWILDLRTTSFAYEKVTIGGKQYYETMTAIANPALWWFALAALLVILALWLVGRDWRIGLIICGYLSLWAPWLLYPERTIFMFYAVAFAPFVTLCATYILGIFIGHVVPTKEPLIACELGLLAPRTRTSVTVRAFAWGIFALIIAVAFYLMPIWTGSPITLEQWQSRMWLPSWI